MKPSSFPQLQLVLAMILAGSTPLVSQIIGHGLPPFTASALRFAVALPLLYGLMLQQGLAWPRPSARDLGLLILQAACGSVAYTSLLVVGMQQTRVSDAAILTATLPAVTAVLAWLLLGHRPGRRLWLAIALATLGAATLQWPGNQPAGQASHWLGNTMVLAAVVCEGVFILLQRRLSQPIPSLSLSALLCLLALLLSLPLAILEQPSAWPASALLGCIYYGALPTALGYWLWYSGAAKVVASRTALLTVVMPLAATVFGLLAGEQLHGAQVAGLLITLLALWLAAGA
ncbi:DMT family transporter [Vogesella urethralis]|uniref:DMT family transporter n=1 Tax=Vogesella urethralis TaxID=2592656 RepID=UPI0011868DDC|nr:DMT family transporter [Vogesella urethralis]